MEPTQDGDLLAEPGGSSPWANPGVFFDQRTKMRKPQPIHAKLHHGSIGLFFQQPLQLFGAWRTGCHGSFERADRR